MSHIARIPTPIFNTPEIPFTQLPLKKDNQGRLMEIEMIALPGTKFNFVSQISENIFQVETPNYPSTIPLYVDSRFLEAASAETPGSQKILPSIDKILGSMEERIGLRYFWGGNWADGIPEILELYPHLKDASPEDRHDASCLGLDCSGILYQATHGYTPRNTSDLITFGTEVSSIEHIKPLDLLVWKGHVLIVLSASTLIESRIGHGVVITPLQQRYLEAMELVKKQNKTLYLRRWHPDS